MCYMYNIGLKKDPAPPPPFCVLQNQHAISPSTSQMTPSVDVALPLKPRSLRCSQIAHSNIKIIPHSISLQWASCLGEVQYALSKATSSRGSSDWPKLFERMDTRKTNASCLIPTHAHNTAYHCVQESNLFFKTSVRMHWLRSSHPKICTLKWDCLPKILHTYVVACSSSNCPPLIFYYAPHIEKLPPSYSQNIQS